MSYFRLVLSRAQRDTTLFDRRRIMTSIVVALVALGFQFGLRIRGGSATLQVGATVVGAYAVVALISFVWNLVTAPARMHGEQESEKNALRLVRATHDDLEKLMEHRREGINLQAKGGGVTPETLDAFTKSHDQWRERTVAFLQERFPAYQWDRFATIGTHALDIHVGISDEGYQALMNRWHMEIHRLDDIRTETIAMLNTHKNL